MLRKKSRIVHPKPNRRQIAKQVRQGRISDREGWGVANDPGLHGLFFYMPVQLEKIILRAKPKKRKARVLDVGCLHGNTLFELFEILGNNAEYWGTSLSFNQNWKNVTEKSNGAIRFRVAMSEALAKKFPRNYFDVIYSNLAMSHSANIDLAVAQARRALRKNGFLVISMGLSQKIRPTQLGFRVVKRVSAFTNCYVLKKI